MRAVASTRVVNLLQRACKECGGPLTGRSDKMWCSAECKREAKRRYDRNRYPTIAKGTIARACEWQRNNREAKAAYDSTYRERNAIRIRERRRAKYRMNPPPRERGNLARARRRARRLQNGDFSVKSGDLARAYNRHQGRCAYCNKHIAWEDVEWDHIVPISRGGSHSIGNLAPSCNPCNRSKAWKFITEWRMGRIVSNRGLRDG